MQIGDETPIGFHEIRFHASRLDILFITPAIRVRVYTHTDDREDTPISKRLLQMPSLRFLDGQRLDIHCESVWLFKSERFLFSAYFRFPAVIIQIECHHAITDVALSLGLRHETSEYDGCEADYTEGLHQRQRFPLKWEASA